MYVYLLYSRCSKSLNRFFLLIYLELWTQGEKSSHKIFMAGLHPVVLL